MARKMVRAICIERGATEMTMEIDPKILEECAKAIGGCTDDEWLSCVGERFRLDCRESARDAIETYERLKPSPWRPIEEAKNDVVYLLVDQHDFKCFGMRSEDFGINPKPGEHKFIITTSFGVPEISECGGYLYVYPTHFMPIPKGPEGKE